MFGSMAFLVVLFAPEFTFSQFFFLLFPLVTPNTTNIETFVVRVLMVDLKIINPTTYDTLAAQIGDDHFPPSAEAPSLVLPSLLPIVRHDPSASLLGVRWIVIVLRGIRNQRSGAPGGSRNPHSDFGGQTPDPLASA